MRQFYFYHLNKDKPASHPEDQNIVIWETCLRKIIFTEKLDHQNLELFEDEQALIFMLEVLCGLQSKVIGETEIFGQFKQFLETDEAKRISFFKNPQFVQYLFKQVKEIRDKHIKQLGVNSYGSMIRKICQSEGEVSLIGYGQLAKKILPWLSHQKVKIHVRDKTKYVNTANVEFLNLDEMNFYSTLIIAAPVKTAKLISFIQPEGIVNKIVDCRSLDEADHSIKNNLNNKSAEIVDLKDLFASIEAKQEKMKQLLPVIREEIQARVQSYLLKAQHRPQGWEDLCG